MKLHVSCLGHVGGLESYWKNFNTLEVHKPQQGLQLSTLSRWRRQAPANVEFVMGTPLNFAETGLRGDAALAMWQQTVKEAQALEAKIVMMRTQASFRPSKENRDALRSFFSEQLKILENEGHPLKVCWAAEGLWDALSEEHQELCRAAGIVPVFDPLALDDDEELPEDDFFYWRLMGNRGLGARFTDHELDMLLELCGERNEGYISFTSAQMMRDAARFVTLAKSELDLEGDA